MINSMSNRKPEEVSLAWRILIYTVLFALFPAGFALAGYTNLDEALPGAPEWSDDVAGLETEVADLEMAAAQSEIAVEELPDMMVQVSMLLAWVDSYAEAESPVYRAGTVPAVLVVMTPDYEQCTIILLALLPTGPEAIPMAPPEACANLGLPAAPTGG
jgi:hypothetical protein